MKTNKRFSPALAVLIILALAFSSLGLVASQAVAAPKDAPAEKPVTAPMPPLPGASCPLDSSTTPATRTCRLFAKTGNLTIPGFSYPGGETNIPFWGFSSLATSAATLPGLTIIANQGEMVVVQLTNNLADPVSLIFPSQSGVEVNFGSGWVKPALQLAADGTVVSMVQSAATGQVVSYRFLATQPGTFLYKSGTDAGRQVTMGLFGTLIVRPSTANGGRFAAYNTATVFQREALLVLSELDPNFNINPDQSLDQFAPKFFLINGQPYPTVGSIAASLNQKVLMRYVNAGLQEHTMGILGVNQTVIGRDGNLLTFPQGAVVESLAPGETVDTMVQIPGGLPNGTQYAVYQANSFMHNNSVHADPSRMLAFGGMLTFIEVTSTGVTPRSGPVVSAMVVDPLKTTGVSGAVITATLTADPARPDGAQRLINQVRYYVDSLLSTPVVQTVSPALNTVNVTVNLSAATLGTWASGEHMVYFQGRDNGGIWGPISSAVLTLDKEGPASESLKLTPAITNGSVSVTLTATGNDALSGASNVVAAKYAIDAVSPVDPASMIDMLRVSPVNPAFISGFEATIPAATIAGLSEGAHVITVRSQDLVRTGPTGQEINWGPESTVELVIDKSGSVTSNVTMQPALVDFTQTFNPFEVRVSATIEDLVTGGVNSKLVAAEGFIGTPGINGKGWKVFPTDGLFDESVEDIYYNIPVAEFGYLASGAHDVFVHGRDAAGNWGAYVAGSFTVVKSPTDTVAPSITALTVSPDQVQVGSNVTLTAVVEDPEQRSNIASAVWFADDTVTFVSSAAFAFTAKDGAFDAPYEVLETSVDVSGWPNGTYYFMVRVTNTAGNVSPVNRVKVVINNPAPALILAAGFEAGDTGTQGWSGTVGSISTSGAAALDGSAKGLQVSLNSTTDPSYAFFNMPVGETSLITSFLFNPNNVNLAMKPVDIFVASNDEAVFGITLTPRTDNKAGYLVKAWVNNNGVVESTSEYTLDADKVHKLGVEWEAGVDKSFRLYVDDVVVGELNSLNTSAYRLHQFRLGAPSGVESNMTGAMYFDAFTADRMALPVDPGTLTNMVYLPSVLR